MKILFAITFPRGLTHPGNEIFVHLWERFAARNRDKLHCDMVFVSQGWPAWHFRTLAPTTPQLVACETNDRPWLDYPVLVTLGQNYDFIFRMDEDSFTTVDNINTLCDFVSSHPEIDFISTSNAIRPVISDGCPDLDRLIHSPHPRNPNVSSYTPWNHTGYGGELYGIKRSFFDRAHTNYRQDSLCRYDRDLRDFTMSFSHVCDLMKYPKDKLTPQMATMKVFWDGAFGTDLWTHMCALGMNAAGIVDKEGRSFRTKNILKAVYEALKFPSYGEVRDERDIAFPRVLNVNASHIFHTENGYSVNWYFNPTTNGRLNPNCATGNIIEVLQAPQSTSFFSWLYAMTEYLTDLTEQHHLIDHLRISWGAFCQEYHIDMNHLANLKKQIVSFYTDALVEYLP